MDQELSDREIRILYKIAHKGRWCNKHMQIRDLIKGKPKHELREYEDAVDALVKRGFLRRMVKGGGAVCAEKSRFSEIKRILEENAQRLGLHGVGFIK